jgi:hypothetical protein
MRPDTPLHHYMSYHPSKLVGGRVGHPESKLMVGQNMNCRNKIVQTCQNDPLENFANRAQLTDSLKDWSDPCQAWESESRRRAWIEHISQINERPTRHILENNVRNTVKPRGFVIFQSLNSFSDLPRRSKGRRINVLTEQLSFFFF